MNNIKYIFVFIALNCMFLKAQETITTLNTNNHDSIILNVSTDGQIQWQSSTNGSDWIDISGATDSVLSISVDNESYYRAMITTVECTIATDTIYISSENQSISSLTEKEIDILIESLYLPMRMWYGGHEITMDLTECSTDIIVTGDQDYYDYPGFKIYTNDHGADGYTMILWNQFQRTISDCNAAEYYVSNSSLDESGKNQLLGEIRFLRAFYRWHIVEIWGGTLNITGIQPLDENDMSIAPVDTFYNQIFRDLKSAELLLPASPEANTQLSRPVVEAFLARMYLTRNNYTDALEYANKLIDNSSYALLDEYSDIWYIHNRTNSEVIYAIDYTIDPDPISYYENKFDSQWGSLTYLTEGGNMTHLYYLTRYDTKPGMKRCVEYGRPWRRYMPTYFFIDLFDSDLDERYHASFSNVWYCNSDYTPIWPDSIYIDSISHAVAPEKVGQPYFTLGDTAILVSNVPVPSNQKAYLDKESTGDAIHPEKGYVIIDINDIYADSGDIVDKSYWIPFDKKFIDSTRVNIYDTRGFRNFFLIRLAEMYLIAAEASMELSDNSSAYNYLLTLANKRSKTGDGTGLLSAYGINGGSDITIDFILDERARELGGEQLRWFDLKRTGKLIERVQLYNKEAGPNIQEYHILRAIPNGANDYVKIDIPQNPGY